MIVTKTQPINPTPIPDPLDGGPETPLTPSRRDALTIIAAFVVQRDRGLAVDLLTSFHDCAARWPHRAHLYFTAADELRDMMGFDRLFGPDGPGPG